MSRLLDWLRVSAEIAVYLVTLAVAALGVLVSVPGSVIVGLGTSLLSAFNLAFQGVMLMFQFLVRVCTALEVGTYVYVRVRFGLLRQIIDRLPVIGFDIAELARTVTRVLCAFFLFILLIGSVVGALTWFPEQNAFQQVIDRAYCQLYPYVEPIAALYNFVIDFYNSISTTLNLIGKILFEFLSEVFLDFLELFGRGALIILRFLGAIFSGDATPLTGCFGTGFALRPYCLPTAENEFLQPDACIVNELICWLGDVGRFIIIDVIGNLLRVFFPDNIVDYLVNIVFAAAESILAIIDIFAGIGASAAGGNNPFATCSNSLPISPGSAAASARACFNDRSICPIQRLICLYFYWFQIFFGSVQQFFLEIFPELINLVTVPFFGFPLGDVLIEFFGIVQTVISIIAEFSDLVNAAIGAFIGPLLEQFEFLYDLVFDIIDDPLGTISDLPGKLLSGSSLGTAIRRVQAIARTALSLVNGVIPVVNSLESAVNTLRSIVDGITSGGGLFDAAPGAADAYVPLNFTAEWAAQVEDYSGLFGLVTHETLALLEIYTNTLHLECDLDPRTVSALTAEYHAMPDLDGFPATITPETLAALQYVLARRQCAENTTTLGSPYYHLQTLSPRLPEDDPCYRPLTYGVLEDPGFATSDEFFACAGVYVASFTHNETGYHMLQRPLTWMMENGTYHNALTAFAGLHVRLHEFAPHLDAEHPNAGHLFVRSDHTEEERAALAADFSAHLTQPTVDPSHPSQARVRELRELWRTGGKSPSYRSVDWSASWAAHKISTHRRARPVLTRAHAAVGRRLLQTSTTRDFNFTDDVIRPIAELLRRIFTAVLYVLITFLRAVGAEVYAQILETAIVFVETFDSEDSLQFLLDMYVNVLDSFARVFDCEYDVIDAPDAPWTIGCIAQLQFPPMLPRADITLETFRIDWGAPCDDLGVCEFNRDVSDTGFFFDDIANAVAVEVTDGPCKSGYESCATLGFTDGFDVLIYLIELASIETGIDIIGFLRSSAFSTFITTLVNFVGLATLPLLSLLGFGDLATELITTGSLRELRYVGPVIFRFENAGLFPRSEFHDFCVAWGYGLTPLPAILLITFFIAVGFFAVRVAPIAANLISSSVAVVRPPTYIDHMAQSMAYHEALDRIIVVKQQPVM